MSRYTMTVVRCDGCGREDVPMVESFGFRWSDRWADICEDCWNAEKYICRLCQRVHDDEHLCDQRKQLEARVDAEYARIEAEERP